MLQQSQLSKLLLKKTKKTNHFWPIRIADSTAHSKWPAIYMHGAYLCVYWPVIMSNLSSSLRIWIWKTEVRPGTWVREFFITFRAYRPSSEPTITIWKQKHTKWQDCQFWHLHSALSNYTASFTECTNQMSVMHTFLHNVHTFRGVNIYRSVQYE